ncbi:MAG: hypothetical protein KF824_07285 [Fimbriimonadaceae bacterium]|nr:MAG: hypothetical protein KF824_07285 [Fimbriimonadaceae bacterium]
MFTALLVAALAFDPQPIVMAERSIGPATPITGGKVHSITIDGSTATLFIPHSFKPAKSIDLWTHFHSADWYVISEYQRTEFHDPLLVFNLGQGSTVYGKPFTEKGVFAKWIAETLKLVPGSPTEVKGLHLTSFSAGFGAVRNIIQDEPICKLLKTVILGDSFYGSLETIEPERKVLPAHVDIWQPLIDQALSGKITVIITTSQITPETYAGTWEVSKAIVEKNGVPAINLDTTSKAANDPTQPLLRRYEKGRLFIWNYAGETPMAHMTHARRLAECIEQSRK